MNDPSLYTKVSEHLALILGFTSIGYLSSTFVSSNWVQTSIGQTLSTLFVVYFYCFKQDIEIYKFAPGLILLIVSCGANSYYVELKDKQ